MRTKTADKAKLCFGFALVFLMMLGETAVAHRLRPSAASPVIWTLLGLGAALCVGLGLHYRRGSRRRAPPARDET